MPGMEKRDVIPANEVEALVAQRVADAVAGVEKRLAVLIEGSVPGVRSSPDTMSMEGLAMAIAALTDQGTGRHKRIDPKELVRREEAHERMVALIERASALKTPPSYRLRHMVYFGEMKVNPVWIDRDHRQQATEIDWYGVPNEALEPINDVARAIYAEFATWIAAAAKRDLGQMRVTANGLAIIKGPPQIVRPDEAQHVGRGGVEGPLTPVIRGRTAPGPMAETHILGTVMPPARQTA
ncbi:MAG TPA: hypothetical protein VN702_05745 [Acetobacteraceae bacterium]|nr:hypothetical protein [Acetobacteraceae bacterium]